MALGLPIKRGKANIAASQSGAELVAAVPGKKIRVIYAFFTVGDTATDATFLSGSTAISHVIQNAANGGAVLGPNDRGWVETVAGEALNLTTGAGTDTGLTFGYVEV